MCPPRDANIRSSIADFDGHSDRFNHWHRSGFYNPGYFYAPNSRASTAPCSCNIWVAGSIRGTSFDIDHDFQKFVCDSRPLGINGEKYLIADYGGKSKKIVARWIFPSSALQTIIQTASDPTRSQHGEHRIYSVSDAMGYRLYRYLPHGYQRIVRCATVVESCDDSGGKRP